MIASTQETAVVILSYNGRKWHELFLPAIVAEADSGYDVVVVDNASTDDTLTYVSEHFPTVKTLQIAVNRGFANGYYEALKLSRQNTTYCSAPTSRLPITGSRR